MNDRPFDKYLTFGCFLLSGCVYVCLKSRCFHWYLSDENIYYYLARDLSFTHIPYRDFFYANPPLLLFLLKMGGVLSGWSVLGLRAVPVLTTVLSGFLLYRTLVPRLGIWAVLPLWILWFPYLALRASTHATGVNVVLLFLFLAYAEAWRGRPIGAGLALGLGLWTKTYAIVAAPGLVVLVWLISKNRQRRSTVEFLGTALSMGGALALAGTLAGGASFWRMNVAYHLNKPEGARSFADTAAEVASDNPGTLLVTALTAAFAIWIIVFVKSKAAGKVGNETTLAEEFPDLRALGVAGAVHCATLLLFLSLQNRVFDFYFLLLLPGLCLGLGALLGFARAKGPNPWLFLAPSAIAATLLAMPLIPNKDRPLFQGPVSYWDHEARNIDRVAELLPRIAAGEGGALSGDSGTAPLLATLSGKKLAGGEADTNAMRFRSGYPNPSEFIRTLEEEEVEWLLVRVQPAGGGARPVGMFGIQDFWEYANTKFEKDDAVQLNSKDAVVLFRRRGE
jgi:hypothetical protein